MEKKKDTGEFVLKLANGKERRFSDGYAMSVWYSQNTSVKPIIYEEKKEKDEKSK